MIRVLKMVIFQLFFLENEDIFYWTISEQIFLTSIAFLKLFQILFFLGK